MFVYEEQVVTEARDSCSIEPDQTPLTTASSLQMTMGGIDGRTRKRRWRVTDHYSVAAGADFFEPQIVGGVGGDPAEPPVADYYDGFGRYVANELRQMDRQSVIIAKRLVNEVVFLGQMGMLNVNTRIEQAEDLHQGYGAATVRRQRAAVVDAADAVPGLVYGDLVKRDSAEA